jgi:hypothetical protein
MTFFVLEMLQKIESKAKALDSGLESKALALEHGKILFFEFSFILIKKWVILNFDIYRNEN